MTSEIPITNLISQAELAVVFRIWSDRQDKFLIKLGWFVFLIHASDFTVLKTNRIRSERVCDAAGCRDSCPQPPWAAGMAQEGQAAASAGSGNISNGLMNEVICSVIWWHTLKNSCSHFSEMSLLEDTKTSCLSAFGAQKQPSALGRRAASEGGFTWVTT